jgi:hypothetical protein
LKEKWTPLKNLPLEYMYIELLLITDPTAVDFMDKHNINAYIFLTKILTEVNKVFAQIYMNLFVKKYFELPAGKLPFPEKGSTDEYLAAFQNFSRDYYSQLYTYDAILLFTANDTLHEAGEHLGLTSSGGVMCRAENKHMSNALIFIKDPSKNQTLPISDIISIIAHELTHMLGPKHEFYDYQNPPKRRWDSKIDPGGVYPDGTKQWIPSRNNSCHADFNVETCTMDGIAGRPMRRFSDYSLYEILSRDAAGLYKCLPKPEAWKQKKTSSIPICGNGLVEVSPDAYNQLEECDCHDWNIWCLSKTECSNCKIMKGKKIRITTTPGLDKEKHAGNRVKEGILSSIIICFLIFAYEVWSRVEDEFGLLEFSINNLRRKANSRFNPAIQASTE